MAHEDPAARVIPFPRSNKGADKNYRKHGLNRNKEGSVRKSMERFMSISSILAKG